MISIMADTDKTHQTFRVIWVAMLISQFVLFGLVYLAKPKVLDLDLTRPFFGDNAAFVVIGLLAIPTLLFLSFTMSAQRRSRAIEKRDVGLLLQSLISGLALAEAITLMGVFLAFTIEYRYFFVWMILGIVATILQYPTRPTVDAVTWSGKSL